MSRRLVFMTMTAALLLVLISCTEKNQDNDKVKDRSKSEGKMIFSHAADSMDGVITLSGVTVDKGDCYEGSGCLRIDADSGRKVRLFETGDVDVENAFLHYSAHLRTRGVEGDAHLELYVYLPDKGRFFSRGLDQSLSGDNNWTQCTTSFILQPGQDPENVQLNLVIKGKGTVWIDDVKLRMAPL